MSRRRFMGQNIIDQDALAFINTAGITSSNQQIAINDLVIDLKRANLWSKMVALYPFIGGTADKHKYNLKNPSKHIISFPSGTRHDTNGVTMYSYSAYMNISTSDLNNNIKDIHLAVYIQNHVNLDNTKDIGQVNSSTTNICSMRSSFSTTYTTYFDNGNEGNGRLSVGVNGTQGFTLDNQLSGYESIFKNGSKLTTKSYSPTNISIGFYLSGYYNTPSYNTRIYSLASIGYGLTDSEQATFYTIIQNYQLSLNRSV